MAINLYTVIEAEDFDIERGFQVESGSFASGGRYVEHDDGSIARMSTVVEGRPGLYDVAVRYFDETDGKSRATLKVDGVVADTWRWDEWLGSANAGTRTATTHVIEDVRLDDDARITIEGRGDGGEPLRIDGIELLPASGRTDRPGLKSFEGAEGFGTTTAGGRGGAIVKVTNLNDSGEGSLRWALEELEMPRIVVFEIGGRVHLKDEIKVKGDVTVAGQTAPGEGITVSGARLRVVEDDVVIRGLKLRPGVTTVNDKQDRDALSIGYDGQTVERVVIDSNSLSWGLDETAVVWFGARDVTFSNNIIAEGLDRTDRAEKTSSFGLLIGDDAKRVSVVGNLLANNEHRNPQVKDAREVEFVNNVVSNYGDNGFQGSAGSNQHTTAHIVGNVFVAGDDTAKNDPVRLRGTSDGTAYYLKDNIGPSRPHGGLSEKAIAEGAGLAEVRSGKVFSSSDVSAMHSSKVLDDVLANVGARVGGGLDDTDARIVRGVEDGSGRIIAHPNQVGGYDAPKATDAPRDRDDDGIPDAFERAVGANPNRFDPHVDGNGDGYTNIETYINGLIDGFDSAPAPSEIPPASSVTGTAAGTVSMEAEAFEFRSNFEVDRNPHAEGGKLVRAVSPGESRLRTEFDGRDGVYDVRVGYFDETDGVSRLALEVEGTTIASWKLDRQLGSHWATEDTLTSRTIRGVEIDRGDSVALVGRSDGDEPLRIDTVDFLLVG